MPARSTQRAKPRGGHPLRHAFAVGTWAFLLAIPLAVASQTVLGRLPGVTVSLVMLTVVMGVGVVFDVIGVAVTAAKEPPLHARAAAGVFGARRAAGLVRNAHAVASFCNDVVGDVTGTLSGALGIAIAIRLLSGQSAEVILAGTATMSALVAALIVGGKAYGKVIALRNSTGIVFEVGKVIEAVAIAGACIPGIARRGRRNR